MHVSEREKSMENMKSKYLKYMVVLIEITIMIVIFVNYNSRELLNLEISAEQLFIASDTINASYNHECISARSNEQTYLEKAEIMSCGPYIPLKKGTYDIKITYSADTDMNQFRIVCNESKYIDSLFCNEKEGFLPSYMQNVVCHIRVLKEIEDLDIQTLYHGIGSLSVNNISIVQTNDDVPFAMLKCFLFFLTIDLILLFQKQICVLLNKIGYKYICIMVMLVFFSSLLTFIPGIYPGHDLLFHIMRIEGLQEAILSGQFPAKLHAAHLFGYGYATGVMYPELFIYIPAILRIIGVSMMTSYKILLIIINLLTVISGYYSFNKIFKDKDIALVGVSLYLLCPYRMMDMFCRSAIGEVSAMIALPLIACGLYSLVTSSKGEKIDIHALVIGYTVAIESHILTTIFVAMFSVIIGCICIKYILTKEKIIAVIKTIIFTILLNLWFIIPFLDYYRLPFYTYEETIQTHGIDVAQLFTNQILSDLPGGSLAANEGIAGELPFGFGYATIFLTVLFLILRKENEKHKKLGMICLCLVFVTIYLSTHYFPWDIVTNIGILQKICYNIQFPWRFLEITSIVVTILACIGAIYSMKYIDRNVIVMITIIIALFTNTFMIDSFMQKNNVISRDIIDSTKIGSFRDYMIQDTDKYAIIQNGPQIIASNEIVSFSNVTKKGTNILFDVISNSEDEQFLEVPLLMYPGYKAYSKPRLFTAQP